ncbi:CHAT domain-containing protein [Microcoleus anatoxicus]|uniref:CHAT domain-containing protein n=1 Tax=Microcoleus anatoxicus TaxID=2705319 RepID=UPI0029705CAC|nr:MAG: CHAT domain-containing protein [Oscillatoriales cyanobacterium]
MNEERIQAYLNLIESLLNCPSGEENQILQANSELVDAGLVQVMLERANDLRKENNLDDANSLMTLAGHLMGTYSNTTLEKSSPATYRKFLMEVLQLTSDSDGDCNVIYALLRDNLNLVNDNLAVVLGNWARETLPNSDSQRRISLTTVIFNFSNALQKFTLGSKASNLEIAIAGYEVALTVFTSQEYAENLAMTQNNLGLAYSDRIRGEKVDNLEMAISIYQEALKIRTREAFPEDWARTQINLGLAYSNRIRGEKAHNLEMAISICQEVLKIRTREAFPEDWAGTQINLGLAYSNRIRGEKAHNLEMAIATYQLALSVYTRETFPFEWANTQNNLAAAYLYRIRGEKADNLEMAISFFEASLSVYTREAFPFEWARSLNNLAAAYNNRIRGEKAHNLEMAISALQASLLVSTRKAFPFEWAGTQNNLASTYIDRIRGEKADNLEQAISACQESLLVYTSEAFPFEWARSLNNLANAYSQRIRGEKADNLEKAISAYHKVLSVYTSEAFPLEWANTQNNLAVAYLYRIRGEETNNLEMSISTFQASLKVYTREAFPFEWARSLNNLGNAYGMRIRGEEADNLEKAIATYQAALSVYTREAFPIDYARSLSNLGIAYQKNSQLPEAYNTFNSAIETVELMRSEIIIGGEADRQKLAEEWNILYQRMVEVCLAMENSTAALEYIERSKTRNLVELFHKARSLPSQVQRISFAEIRSLLAENEAILEWYITYNSFKVLIVTRDSPQPDIWQSSYQDLQALEELQQEYLDDIKDEKKYDNWKNQLDSRLKKLAQILHIDEIISRLPENCQKLILVPFRYLHLFPLHALTSSRKKADKTLEIGCLLELFPGGVRYTPSCQLLQLSQRENLTAEDSSPSKFFAIQNPTEDLDFTDIEVEAIAKSFNPAEVLIREKASKAGLQQQIASLQNADIAHFSCHGFFDFDNPEKSALILAGAKVTPLNPPLVRGETGEDFPLLREETGGNETPPLSKGGAGGGFPPRKSVIFVPAEAKPSTSQNA